MAQACPKCSRQNPADARYCYADGAPLGRAVKAGGGVLHEFPRPFVFPSGRSCRSFDQLAIGCAEEWSQARDLLLQGHLATFLGGLGRADLAQAARECAQFPHRDRALSQFLGRLPTDVISPPKLQVEPLSINLGVLKPGEDQHTELRLANHGQNLLYGTIAAVDCPWLTLGEAPGTPEKSFQLLREGTIRVNLRGAALRASKSPLDGTLVVDTNGGTQTVQIRVQVPVTPFPEGVLAGARSPRELAEKARDHPHEAVTLFTSEAVSAWYRANGWTYPVQGPMATGVAAVQQYFEALGVAAAPKVTLSQERFNLEAPAGSAVRFRLTVRTEEQRPVFASAACDQPWLRLDRVEMEGRTAKLRFVIPSVPFKPGERIEARITVQSNGKQRFVVPVSMLIGAATPGSVAKLLEVLPADEPEADASELLEVLPVASIPAVPPVISMPPRKRSRHRSGSYEREPSPVLAFVTRTVLPLAPVAFLALAFLVVLVHDVAIAPASSSAAGAGIFEGTTIELAFHDQPIEVELAVGGSQKPEAGSSIRDSRGATWDPTMRFGISVPGESSARLPFLGKGTSKRLTFEVDGTTGNTCLHVDGNEWIFGDSGFRVRRGLLGGRSGQRLHGSPGRWLEKNTAIDRGRTCRWIYDDQKLVVTQTAQVVRGEQSGNYDTCLVRYLIENQDQRSHNVGLRFLLDTFIGENDGVPFLIPGADRLCTTSAEFNEKIPDFIQAFEHENLAEPGVVAQLQLKLRGGIEPPSRVTLGAYPNPRLQTTDPRCEQEMTRWTVPVLPMRSLPPGDSAVTMYWGERPLNAGKSREVGFAYGLGQVASKEGRGELAVTAGGDFAPGGNFTVTAYIRKPQAGQKVSLVLPDGFTLLEGESSQTVPTLTANATSNFSPVTWRVRSPNRDGAYDLTVRSSRGESQTQHITLRQRGLFGD